MALGGGGATHGLDPALDDFVCQGLNGVGPRLGFIGWAGAEPQTPAQRVRERYARWADWRGPPPEDPSPQQLQRWLDGCDLVYVGGGDMGRLLRALERAQAADKVLRALERGLTLVGVSAGASVWFDWALSDTGGAGLRPARGLGLFPGSFCPHYHDEAQRRSAFEQAVADGALPPGFGVDDGAALALPVRGTPSVCTARPQARVWRVTATGGSLAWPAA